MKKAIILLVLATLVAGGAFAQKGGQEGFIRSTFSIGVSSMTVEGSSQGVNIEGKGDGFNLSASFDYVNSLGITLGFRIGLLPEFTTKTTMSAMGMSTSSSSDSDQFLASIGLGYTYVAEKFCAGGKLLFTHLPNPAGFAAGIGLDGTYWFLKDLGVTAIFDIYFIDFKQGDGDNSVKMSGPGITLGVGASFRY